MSLMGIVQDYQGRFGPTSDGIRTMIALREQKNQEARKERYGIADQMRQYDMARMLNEAKSVDAKELQMIKNQYDYATDDDNIKNQLLQVAEKGVGAALRHDVKSNPVFNAVTGAEGIDPKDAIISYVFSSHGRPNDYIDLISKSEAQYKVANEAQAFIKEYRDAKMNGLDDMTAIQQIFKRRNPGAAKVSKDQYMDAAQTLNDMLKAIHGDDVFSTKQEKGMAASEDKTKKSPAVSQTLLNVRKQINKYNKTPDFGRQRQDVAGAV